MESETTGPPIRVCRRCSVQSRTDAEVCPNCGTPYVRRLRPRWSWWFAIPIVIVAFAIGYFGRIAIQDGDEAGEAGVIELEQATSVEGDVSRSALIEDLGDPVDEESTGRGANQQTCLVYVVSDQEDTFWRFCFQGDGALTSSEPVPVGS